MQKLIKFQYSWLTNQISLFISLCMTIFFLIIALQWPRDAITFVFIFVLSFVTLSRLIAVYFAFLKSPTAIWIQNDTFYGRMILGKLFEIKLKEINIIEIDNFKKIFSPYSIKITTIKNGMIFFIRNEIGNTKALIEAVKDENPNVEIDPQLLK